jgi:hypothetical protein
VVDYCTASHILPYIQLHIAVESVAIGVQSVTHFSTISHKLLYSHIHIAVQSVTHWCTDSYIMLYSQLHIAVQSVTFGVSVDTHCCTVSDKLL